MVQAAEAQKRCPNCNAKLPEQPLSLCSYCAMPLDLAEGAEKRESKHTARILKVREHEKFAAAETFQPPESYLWQQGWRLGYTGKVLIGLGVASLALGALLGGFAPLGIWSLLGYALVILGAVSIVRGRKFQAEETKLPILRRPALIVDRRSDTTIRGWGGETQYFFEIEFEDGGVGEFGMQGKGVNEEPYTTNLPGVAYTRGTTLLHFQHIRV